MTSFSLVIFLVFLLIVKLPTEKDVENKRKQREAFMKNFAKQDLQTAIIKLDINGKILADQPTPLKIAIFPKQDCESMTTTLEATEDLTIIGVSSLTHVPCGRALHPISVSLQKGEWGRLHILVKYNSNGKVLRAKSTELYLTPSVEQSEIKKVLDPKNQVGIGYQ